MSKVYVLGLFIFSLFLFTATVNSVKAASFFTATVNKAIEQGWVKTYAPAGDKEEIGSCAIHQPTDSELSSLIDFCKTNETSWTIEAPSNCEHYIRNGMMKKLCVQSRDSASYLKLTYAPIRTRTPTPTLTVTPTITPTLTPTPTPVNVTNYKIAKSLYFNKKIGDMTFNELVGMIKQLVMSLITFKK